MAVMNALTLQSHLHGQARYHVWATHRLLEAVSRESAEDSAEDYQRDVGLFFKSIHGTLNHLLLAEHLLWYARFSKGASPVLALNAEVEADRECLTQMGYDRPELDMVYFLQAEQVSKACAKP